MIARVASGSGHYYMIDGARALGVTTAIKSALPNPALVPWAARTVAEYVADNEAAVEALRTSGRSVLVNALKAVPTAARSTAANVGTQVHGLAQQLVHGAEVMVPDHLAGYVNAAVSFMDQWKVRPLLVERVVAHRIWGYAGTLDLVAELPDGRRLIFDYKTGRGVYPEVALQLAAYRYAQCYLSDDTPAVETPMSEVDIAGAAVVWLHSSGAYKVISVRADTHVFNAFLHVAYVARATAEMKDWLLGEIEAPC